MHSGQNGRGGGGGAVPGGGPDLGKQRKRPYPQFSRSGGPQDRKSAPTPLKGVQHGGTPPVRAPDHLSGHPSEICPGSVRRAWSSVPGAGQGQIPGSCLDGPSRWGIRAARRAARGVCILRPPSRVWHGRESPGASWGRPRALCSQHQETNSSVTALELLADRGVVNESGERGRDESRGTLPRDSSPSRRRSPPGPSRQPEGP